MLLWPSQSNDTSPQHVMSDRHDVGAQPIRYKSSGYRILQGIDGGLHKEKEIAPCAHGGTWRLPSGLDYVG